MMKLSWVLCSDVRGILWKTLKEHPQRFMNRRRLFKRSPLLGAALLLMCLFLSQLPNVRGQSANITNKGDPGDYPADAHSDQKPIMTGRLTQNFKSVDARVWFSAIGPGSAVPDTSDMGPMAHVMFLPVAQSQGRFDIIGTIQGGRGCQFDATVFDVLVEQVILDEGGTLVVGTQAEIFVGWGPNPEPPGFPTVGDRVEVSGVYVQEICGAHLSADPSSWTRLEGPVCNEGTVNVLEMCPNGSTWTHRQVCRNNAWVDEYQQCPTPPPACSGGQYWNGQQCVCPSGQQWNGQQCVTPQVCSEGAVNVLERCPDGTWKHRQVCRNNAWVDEYQQCPTPTTTITTSAEQGDLALERIELVQSVYDVPLVTMKPTVIRATVKSSFPSSVQTEFSISFGTEHRTSIREICPENKGTCICPGTYFLPAEGYFIVPQPGDVTVTVDIKVVNQGETRLDNKRHSITKTFTFVQAQGIKILFIPLAVEGNSPGPPSTEEMNEIMRSAVPYVLGLYPFNYVTTSFSVINEPIYLSNILPRVLDTADAYLRMDGIRKKTGFDYVIGIVKPGYFDPNVFGVANCPDNTRICVGPQAVSEPDVVTIAHELGHWLLGSGMHEDASDWTEGYWPERHVQYSACSSLEYPLMYYAVGGEPVERIWISRNDYLTVLNRYKTSAAVTGPSGGTIFNSQSILEPLDIPSGLESLTASVTWGGSRIDFVLIDPDGRTHMPNGVSPTRLDAEISNPIPGIWYIVTTGTEIPPAGEDYHVDISMQTAGGGTTHTGDQQNLVLTLVSAVITAAVVLVSSEILLRRRRRDRSTSGGKSHWRESVAQVCPGCRFKGHIPQRNGVGECPSCHRKIYYS